MQSFSCHKCIFHVYHRFINFIHDSSIQLGILLANAIIKLETEKNHLKLKQNFISSNLEFLMKNQLIKFDKK